MKAIVLTGKNKVICRDVPQPLKAADDHLLIRMHASGINSGDKLFIAGAFPRGIPLSRHDIAGVSGTGTVVEAGPNVPDYYLGKKVTIYRSLWASEHTVGTWSEFAHLHYLNCAILPDDADSLEYAGSLVNTITPFAFLEHIKQEGHQVILCTAGNSATGIALLGLCQAYNFPIISIIRNGEGKKYLQQLGATNILVQTDPQFKKELQYTVNRLSALAVFDGVGGAALNGIMDILPFNTTIYAYGFLGKEALAFPTALLMRGITIKGFSNFRTATVLDPEELEKALLAISQLMHMPHFKTKVGSKFCLHQVNEALAYSSVNGERAVLCFNSNAV